MDSADSKGRASMFCRWRCTSCAKPSLMWLCQRVCGFRLDGVVSLGLIGRMDAEGSCPWTRTCATSRATAGTCTWTRITLVCFEDGGTCLIRTADRCWRAGITIGILTFLGGPGKRISKLAAFMAAGNEKTFVPCVIQTDGYEYVLVNHPFLFEITENLVLIFPLSTSIRTPSISEVHSSCGLQNKKHNKCRVSISFQRNPYKRRGAISCPLAIYSPAKQRWGL